MRTHPQSPRRFSRASALGLAGSLALAAAACGSSGTSEPGANGSGEIRSIEAAATGLQSPFDATPNPDGSVIYFTSLGEESGGLFRVAAGGGAPTLLAEGFASPLSVVTAMDGQTVYVADAAWEPDDAAGEQPPGVVFTVPAAGGEKAPLSATRGFAPRGLDLVSVGGRELLYFTGVDPADGVRGVFRADIAGGGAVETVRKDDLVDPSGVAVASDGAVYVSDTQDGLAGAKVWRLRGDAMETLIGDVRVGYPAGIALTQDESALFISALAPTEASAQVYKVQVASGEATVLSDGLSANTESAGVHRAHDADVYAWANAATLAQGGGQVYLLR
ncbi:MAG: hypothetical protein H6744_13165 [Deltaproteobacteria bacterium]|nr:hypothetical protein [Deltaproteobacteria bacterium]